MDLSLIEIVPPELLIVRAQCTIMCMFVIGRVHVAARVSTEFSALKPGELGVHLAV